MSCWLGVSPTPLTTPPFSVSDSCLPSALPRRACSMVSPWSSPRFCATRCPRWLYHGPLPMRSRALTALAPWVLRYACHITPPRPAAAASDWPCAAAAGGPAQRVAGRVGPGEPAVIGAVAFRRAGDEERHRLRRRLLSAALRRPRLPGRS